MFGYLDEKKALRFIDYALILSMAGSRRDSRDFVLDGLRRGMESPFSDVKGRIILGRDEFVAKAKGYLGRGSVREQPAYRDLVVRTLEPAVVVRTLTKVLSISEELLKRRGSKGMMRGMVAELLHKYSDITQAQIGRLLGEIDYMTVYQLRKRFKEKRLKHAGVRKQYAKAEVELKKLML